MAANSLFTLAELADQVCYNLGAVDNITQIKVRKHINRALLRFSEMGEWSWQRVYDQAFPATVAGQKIYTVPSCLRIESIFLSSPIQRRLALLDDRQYRRLYPNDIAGGMPYYYRHAGRMNAGAVFDALQVGLYPIPDAVYTLHWDGVRPISLLVADTDDIRTVTGMPVTLVDLVIEMATAIGWKEIDDADAATQMQEVLLRLKSAYSMDQHDIEDRHVMTAFEGGNLDGIFDPVLPPTFGE